MTRLTGPIPVATTSHALGTRTVPLLRRSIPCCYYSCEYRGRAGEASPDDGADHFAVSGRSYRLGFRAAFAGKGAAANNLIDGKVHNGWSDDCKKDFTTLRTSVSETAARLDIGENAALLMHEVLHNRTGMGDEAIQQALHL